MKNLVEVIFTRATDFACVKEIHLCDGEHSSVSFTAHTSLTNTACPLRRYLWTAIEIDQKAHDFHHHR